MGRKTNLGDGKQAHDTDLRILHVGGQCSRAHLRQNQQMVAKDAALKNSRGEFSTVHQGVRRTQIVWVFLEFYSQALLNAKRRELLSEVPMSA